MAFNDHTNWTWDERVLRTLTSLGQAFAHLCIQLTDYLQGFDGYADRYSCALAKVRTPSLAQMPSSRCSVVGMTRGTGRLVRMRTRRCRAHAQCC